MRSRIVTYRSFDYLLTTMIERWRWSVPANLLVAGEYAITSPGGLGVAVAVDPRATAQVFVREAGVQPGPDLAHQPGEIVAHAAGTSQQVYPDADHPLVDAIVDHAVPTVDRHSPMSSRGAPQWRIEIDTSQFFDAESGRKQGLGSSAAAAVLLTAALYQLSGWEPVLARDEVIRTAIAAHRAANGGRGSGYDIATSALGGVVRFTGGANPTWRPSSCVHKWNAHGLHVFGWYSGTSVTSSGAVGRFDRYLPEGSSERTDFIERNNSVVDRIEGAASWSALFKAISDARNLGEEIGATVGVPAKIDICQPHRDDGWVVKASGAGNERAIILAQPTPRRSVPRQAAALPVSSEGLRWEYDSDRDAP
jgi:phosphomevalonate kinase